MNNLQNTIGYHFRDDTLLKEALTHKSYANEKRLNYDYQRLEFLGDGVLQMVVSDYLIDKYPKFKEGELSKTRAAIVSEKALSQKAKEIGLNQCIRLGKGEIMANSCNKSSILCDVIEALIGAIWKDGGYKAVKSFIDRFIIQGAEIDNKDYKSRLFELLGNKLSYSIIEESGKDHEKVFTVAAIENSMIIGVGTGSTKKAAEQAAAKEALDKITKTK